MSETKDGATARELAWTEYSGLGSFTPSDVAHDAEPVQHDSHVDGSLHGAALRFHGGKAGAESAKTGRFKPGKAPAGIKCFYCGAGIGGRVPLHIIYPRREVGVEPFCGVECVLAHIRDYVSNDPRTLASTTAALERAGIRVEGVKPSIPRKWLRDFTTNGLTPAELRSGVLTDGRRVVDILYKDTFPASVALALRESTGDEVPVNTPQPFPDNNGTPFGLQKIEALPPSEQIHREKLDFEPLSEWYAKRRSERLIPALQGDAGVKKVFDAITLLGKEKPKLWTTMPYYQVTDAIATAKANTAAVAGKARMSVEECKGAIDRAVDCVLEFDRWSKENLPHHSCVMGEDEKK